MARRMSNRQRIDRMREEAEIGASERKRAREPTRFKYVWALRNAKGEIVAVHPYARRPAADADAKRRGCTVIKHKVPFDS